MQIHGKTRSFPLRSPDHRERPIPVGGFYFATNTWKLRFAPMQAGAWTWTLSYTDSNGVFNASGGFNCTNSSNIGFLRGIPPMFIISLATPKVMSSEFLDINGDGLPPSRRPTQLIFRKHILRPTGTPSPRLLTNSYRIPQDVGFNMIRINTQEDAFDHLSPYGHFNINSTGKNEYDLIRA